MFGRRLGDVPSASVSHRRQTTTSSQHHDEVAAMSYAPVLDISSAASPGSSRFLFDAPSTSTSVGAGPAHGGRHSTTTPIRGTLFAPAAATSSPSASLRFISAASQQEQPWSPPRPSSSGFSHPQYPSPSSSAQHPSSPPESSRFGSSAGGRSLDSRLGLYGADLGARALRQSTASTAALEGHIPALPPQTLRDPALGPAACLVTLLSHNRSLLPVRAEVAHMCDRQTAVRYGHGLRRGGGNAHAADPERTLLEAFHNSIVWSCSPDPLAALMETCLTTGSLARSATFVRPMDVFGALLPPLMAEAQGVIRNEQLIATVSASTSSGAAAAATTPTWKTRNHPMYADDGSDRGGRVSLGTVVASPSNPQCRVELDPFFRRFSLVWEGHSQCAACGVRHRVTRGDLSVTLTLPRSLQSANKPHVSLVTGRAAPNQQRCYSLDIEAELDKWCSAEWYEDVHNGEGEAEPCRCSFDGSFHGSSADVRSAGGAGGSNKRRRHVVRSGVSRWPETLVVAIDRSSSSAGIYDGRRTGSRNTMPLTYPSTLRLRGGGGAPDTSDSVVTYLLVGAVHYQGKNYHNDADDGEAGATRQRAKAKKTTDGGGGGGRGGYSLVLRSPGVTAYTRETPLVLAATHSVVSGGASTSAAAANDRWFVVGPQDDASAAGGAGARTTLSSVNEGDVVGCDRETGIAHLDAAIGQPELLVYTRCH